jgi:hypothetical protein
METNNGSSLLAINRDMLCNTSWGMTVEECMARDGVTRMAIFNFYFLEGTFRSPWQFTSGAGGQIHIKNVDQPQGEHWEFGA